MKFRFVSIVLLCALLALLSSCSDDSDNEKSKTVGQESPVVVFQSIDGTHGDITIQYILAQTDVTPRSVTLYYTGGCAGTEWTEAVTSGDKVGLNPEAHILVWNSWDQEAGCAGEVTLRLTTDKNESATAAPFKLDNTVGDNSGFFDFPLEHQGIQDEEAEDFERAVEALTADESVDFVATRRGDTYEVYAARGTVFFRRDHTNKGYDYVIDDVTGENPIGNQDPSDFPTYAEELAAGSNPEASAIPELGYDFGDPRLSFIEPEDDSYPFGYERIAAYFDNPNSADFMINWKSYSHFFTDPGEHGSLSMVQSRSPLIFWGRGIEPGRLSGEYRQVDLAPTIAKMLNFPTTFGVDERGIYSRNVYLQWQDGHPIDEVLSGDTPDRVIVLVFDGLTHTELIRCVDEHPDLLPNFAKLFSEGAVAEHGSITNWPSVTYPSHNVIGSGMYSGHHGLVDNQYYLRKERRVAAPITQTFFTSAYWNPFGEGETLHEAFHRVMGNYGLLDKSGVVTASLYDPSVYGATKADLEFRDFTGQSPFPPLGVEWPGGLPLPRLDVDSFNAYFEQYVTTIGMVELYHLFENGVSPNPVYIIFNSPVTDGFGHENGPHHDAMINVFQFLDENIGLMLTWLENWGLADDTAIILTSDHGMQLGDPSRSSWPPDTLVDAGVKFVPDTFLGIYLQTMEVVFYPDTVKAGEDQVVQVWSVDASNNYVTGGAEIHADFGSGTLDVVTDSFGYAELHMNPSADVQITITHPDYNTKNYTLTAE